MAGNLEERVGGVSRRCPRCVICGVVVRVRGVGTEGVWCYIGTTDTAWEYCDVRKCYECDKGEVT